MLIGAITAQRSLRCWFKRFWPLIVVFLLAQAVVRVTLAVLSGAGFIDGPWDLVRPFAIGLWFDLAVLLIALIPGTLYWVLLPKSWHGGRFDHAMTVSGFALFVSIIGFTMIGEVLFWNEFGGRFNFIAVDYLIYTREVAGNIWELYPVGRMLAALARRCLAGYNPVSQSVACFGRRGMAPRPCSGACIARAGGVSRQRSVEDVVD